LHCTNIEKGVEMSRQDKVKERVREHYAAALDSHSCGSTPTSDTAGCCSSGAIAVEQGLVQLSGYKSDELSSLPENAVQNSFGCGNPVAFAGVESGQVVVDIGSGAGIDCLLASERVGPEGRVIGLDMTPVMIERAKDNARSAGKDNVEFRLGDAESMPIEDASADWIISNCVINLSPDKKRVFREAFRVLKPGGRISVSDIVASIPRILRVQSLHASCLTGALPETEYIAAIEEAGFEDVRVVSRLIYDIEQLGALLGDNRFVGKLARWAAKPWLRPLSNRFLRKVASVQVMAVKPKEARAAA
jgi:ubiquinone/menaquinone biosynthesis C-methylase UbiE